MLLIATFSVAQENETNLTFELAQNELSINLPFSTFGQFPMFSYERLSSADFGYGASLGFAVGDGDIDLNYQLVPFARWYFLNSGNETVFGRRFFIEANASIFGYDDNYYDYDADRSKTKSEFGGGLGLGIGYKYVNPSNWIGSIYIGGGKNFAEDKGYGGYPHIGINIGKRF